MRHRKQHSAYLFPLLFSLSAEIVVLLSTSSYGIGTSPDSIAYISTARNLLADKGFVLFDGTLYVAWPPLFPTLLALIGSGGMDLLVSSRFVNAICLALITFISSYWLLDHIHLRPLALLGSAAIVLSPPLITVSLMAWSEPLFILLTLLCLFALERLLKGDKYEFYLLSILFAALALVTRYSGSVTILVGVLVLLFQRTALRIRRIVDSVSFALLSSLPLCIWLGRNYLVASTLVGDRGASTLTLRQNIYMMLYSIGDWFLPVGSNMISSIFSIALICILAVGLAHKYDETNRKDISSLSSLPFLIFTTVYVCYLVATESTLALDPIDSRLLSPIGIPLIFSIVIVADNLRLSLARQLRERTANLLIVGGLGILFVYWMGYAGAVARVTIQNGLGYSTAAWESSALVRLIGNLPSANLFTNEPEAVYLYTRRPVKRSPRAFKYNSSTKTDDLAAFTRLIKQSGSVYLVWFNDSHWPNLVSLDTLETSFKFETIATTREGAIYILK